MPCFVDLELTEAVVQRCSARKVFLEISQNSQESTCCRPPVNFAKFYNFIKKETLAQAFFCEFSEISKNTFFTEYLRAIASELIFTCIVFEQKLTVRLNENHWNFIEINITFEDIKGYNQ